MRLISFGGVRWEVCETPRLADRRDRTSSRSVLYFLSRAGSRRCDEFPRNWESLTDKDLCALLARARSLAETAVFAMSDSRLGTSDSRLATSDLR